MLSIPIQGVEIKFVKVYKLSRMHIFLYATNYLINILERSPSHLKVMFKTFDKIKKIGDLQLQEGRKDIVTNPLLIAEVLSESTKAYDRDEKFKAYRTISSFQEYVLIDQYAMHIEQYTRTDTRQWLFTESEIALLNLEVVLSPSVTFRMPYGSWITPKFVFSQMLLV